MDFELTDKGFATVFFKALITWHKAVCCTYTSHLPTLQRIRLIKQAVPEITLLYFVDVKCFKACSHLVFEKKIGFVSGDVTAGGQLWCLCSHLVVKFVSKSLLQCQLVTLYADTHTVIPHRGLSVSNTGSQQVCWNFSNIDITFCLLNYINILTFSWFERHFCQVISD